MTSPAPTIEVVPYDEAWPARFEARARHVEGALAGCRARVEHVGSTSVPGLPAKPTIDLLVVVPTLGDADRAAALLQAAGYGYVAEYERRDLYGDDCLPSRRFLYLGERPSREANLHVFTEGDPEGERHLAFRDWLREHPQDRDAYAALKQGLAAQHGADVDAYTEAKTDFIRAIESRAAAEASRAGGRVVEWSSIVAAAPQEVYDLVRSPTSLATWYANSASETEAGTGPEAEVEGGPGAHAAGSAVLRLGFNEEYGYRRVVQCAVELEQPAERLEWRWLSQHRTFDGQLVAQAPAVQAGARWADANMAGQLGVDWRFLPEPGGGTRVLLRGHGYGHDTRWDHTLIEHAAWWQHYLGERLPGVAGGRAEQGQYELDLATSAPPGRVWRALVSQAEQSCWLPEGLRLPDRSGAVFAARWAGGQVRASVQTLMRQRCVRVAWHAPGVLGTTLELGMRRDRAGGGTRLTLRHGGWPADGGPGEMMQATARHWERALERLAGHLGQHPW
jgi:GrpB-like predicted nucleotidyltransferase (UPF0157 family)